MTNPFAHEPKMEAREGRNGLEKCPVVYELRRPDMLRAQVWPEHVGAYVCPTKMLQEMKEKLL